MHNLQNFFWHFSQRSKQFRQVFRSQNVQANDTVDLSSVSHSSEDFLMDAAFDVHLKYVKMDFVGLVVVQMGTEVVVIGFL